MIGTILRFWPLALLMHFSLVYSDPRSLGENLNIPFKESIDKEVPKATLVSNIFPVDLSFSTIDLKYNQEKGVQILEFNTGIRSRYLGSAFINEDPDIVAKNFVDVLALYQSEAWYHPGQIASLIFRRVFQESGYHAVDPEMLNMDTSFKKAANSTVYDPQNTWDYHGVYLGNIQSVTELKKFRKTHPGIIPLSAAVIKIRRDKGKVNKIFTSHKSLKPYKPSFVQFKKSVSSKLIRKILGKIGSERLVIKPLSSTGGKGVIIVHRDELKHTLRYIFSKSKELTVDRDISYRWWAHDTSKDFIVEEFVESETIFVPHLDNKPYDGTMRVVVFFAYSNQEIAIHFLDKYWKLPPRSLDEEGSLNKKHKSSAKGSNFSEVSEDVWKRVEAQLQEALTTFYSIALSEN